MKRYLSFAPRRSVLAAATLTVAVAGIGLAGGSLLKTPATTVMAACSPTPPAADNGVVTQTVKVATEGNFRLWSRIKAADAEANSYGFQVDDGCVYTVGDANIQAGAWTWVDYQDASSGSKIDITLPAGQHTLKYYGREAGVSLDKIMLLADKGCVPTGQGDNCGQLDETAPTVAVTAPSAGSVLQNTATFKADASDAGGITKVEFLLNGVVRGSDSSAPYELAFDTRTLPTGQYALTAKAYDTSDNSATSAAVTLMIQNRELVPSAGNLLNGKVFSSSTPDSVIEAGNLVKFATDGNEFTRWISEPVNDTTLTTDLGSTKTLAKVSILWAADTVKNYAIQMSSDNANWRTVSEGMTNNSQRQLIDTTSFSQVATGRYLRIVAKDRWNDKFGNSIWEVGAYTSAAPAAETASDGGYYVSDMIPTTAANGWGPYERDMSNGDNSPYDGNPLMIGGTKYAKGLGVHARSELTYQINGSWSRFKSDIGVDDEAGIGNQQAGVGFEVWGDGRQLYKSGYKRPVAERAEQIDVDVRGVRELKLVVNDGNGDNGNDHADWASARLISDGSGPVVTPTPTPAATTAPTPAVTATPGAKRGDLNGDGKVNILDLSRLLAKFGQADQSADLNGDGKVTITDLSILLSGWTG